MGLFIFYACYFTKDVVYYSSTCRCDGMVDVVDSKSTAGDSVPVRVRSPAPKIQEWLLPLLYFYAVTDSKPFIWDSPVDCPCHQCKHWWLPILSSHAKWEDNANRVRSPAPRQKERGVCLSLFVLSSIGTDSNPLQRNCPVDNCMSLVLVQQCNYS